MPNMLAPAPAVIEVRDLRMSFDGARYVLDGINLSVARGETLVIIGSSGCGKSTLLRNMIRNLSPTSGSVLLFGQDIGRIGDGDMDVIRKRFGIAFQYGALYGSMTIAENISLPIIEHFPEIPSEVVEVMVLIKLEQVGLNGIGHLMPSDISGGMRKRVAVARATALDPELMFYDEPTAGLDPITIGVIVQLVMGIARQQHATSVVVTHNMAAAFQIADRIIMLHEGKIVAGGTPAEIQTSGDALVQQFINGQPQGPIPLRLPGPSLSEELIATK